MYKRQIYDLFINWLKEGKDLNDTRPRQTEFNKLNPVSYTHLDKLKNFISKVPLLDLVGTFDNGLDAFDFLQSNTLDLLFLDIQMEQFTGIQLLKALHTRPHIIITSAYGCLLYTSVFRT